MQWTRAVEHVSSMFLFATTHFLHQILSIGNASTGVASVHTDYPGPSLQVEFHVSQDDSLHLGAARIHHCLLHLHDSDDVRALRGDLTAIGDLFSHFAYLETVVLEIGHELETDNVQPLIEALRKVCRADVRHRTSEEAHELALQAKKSPSRSFSAVLLSPFWCLQEHVHWWEHW